MWISMTLDGFQRYLKPWIDRKLPFIAYWHPRGAGRVLTSFIPQTRILYKVHYADGREPRTFSHPNSADRAMEKARAEGVITKVERLETPAPPKPLRKSTITAFRREIRKMERNPRTQPLITVEFDGEHITAIGGFTYE